MTYSLHPGAERDIAKTLDSYTEHVGPLGETGTGTKYLGRRAAGFKLLGDPCLSPLSQKGADDKQQAEDGV